MAKAKSPEELSEYLKEHLAYEREMLGFTFKMLFETARHRWCAMFESFGLHGRNLYDFLRHEGLAGNTLRADDYVPGRSKPAPSNVLGRLNASFFHLSKERLRGEPVTFRDAIEFGAWIDREWARWVEQLPATYKQLADPSPVCVAPMDTLPGGQTSTATSATNHVIVLNSSTKGAEG